MGPSDDNFQRGFVAAAYLVGRRGPALLDGLPEPSRRSQALAKVLAHPDRQVRASALAPELGSMLQALEARRLV